MEQYCPYQVQASSIDPLLSSTGEIQVIGSTLLQHCLPLGVVQRKKKKKRELGTKKNNVQLTDYNYGSYTKRLSVFKRVKEKHAELFIL